MKCPLIIMFVRNVFAKQWKEEKNREYMSSIHYLWCMSSTLLWNVLFFVPFDSSSQKTYISVSRHCHTHHIQFVIPITFPRNEIVSFDTLSRIYSFRLWHSMRFCGIFFFIFGAKNRMENSVCECLNLKMVCSDWNGMESIPNGNKSYTLNIIHKLFVSSISTLKVKLFNIIVTERLEWNACRRHRNSCVSKHFNAKGKLLLPTNIDDIFDAKKKFKRKWKEKLFPTHAALVSSMATTFNEAIQLTSVQCNKQIKRSESTWCVQKKKPQSSTKARPHYDQTTKLMTQCMLYMIKCVWGSMKREREICRKVFMYERREHIHVSMYEIDIVRNESFRDSNFTTQLSMNKRNINIQFYMPLIVSTTSRIYILSLVSLECSTICCWMLKHFFIAIHVVNNSSNPHHQHNVL